MSYTETVQRPPADLSITIPNVKRPITPPRIAVSASVRQSMAELSITSPATSSDISTWLDVNGTNVGDVGVTSVVGENGVEDVLIPIGNCDLRPPSPTANDPDLERSLIPPEIDFRMAEKARRANEERHRSLYDDDSDQDDAFFERKRERPSSPTTVEPELANENRRKRYRR